MSVFNEMNKNEIPQWLEDLAEEMLNYDRENGTYPESRLEGLSVFKHILDKCPLSKDLRKDILSSWKQEYLGSTFFDCDCDEWYFE